MKVFMKAGDEIYINGSHLKVDRKVSIELLNSSKFLLQNHMIDPEDINSPLEKLYFAIQLMIINPANFASAETLYRDLKNTILTRDHEPAIRQLIARVDRDLLNGNEFKALQLIRNSLATAGGGDINPALWRSGHTHAGGKKQE